MSSQQKTGLGHLPACPACAGGGLLKGAGVMLPGGSKVPYHDCTKCYGSGVDQADALTGKDER
jgi:hypothetical protein